jgi:hypothetical protein
MRPLRIEILDTPNARAECSVRAAAHRWLAGVGVGLWLSLFAVCCARGNHS